MVPALDEQASGRERVRQTAEALAHLKQSEMQCLLLKALGYSYDEIADRTGYSWTKVNRSLTEGRRRFLERFGELGAGERCAGFQALLSTACDGEATKAEERALKAHLDRCGGCRAALRSYRTAPDRVAELFPPGILFGAAQPQGWWSRLGDWLSISAGDRAGAVAWKVQQGAEAITAQKAAAVAASTAALAGGAAVHEHRAEPAHRPPPSARVERAPKARTAVVTPVPAAAPVPARPEPTGAGPDADPAPADAARSDPAEEFAPAPAAGSAGSSREGTVPAQAELAGPVSAAASGSGGGEFGP
jgi:hypothetical protein